MASAPRVVVEIVRLIRARAFQVFFFSSSSVCVSNAKAHARRLCHRGPFNCATARFFFSSYIKNSSDCTSTILFRSGCFIPNSDFYSDLQFWSSPPKWYRGSAEFHNRGTFQTCPFMRMSFLPLCAFVFQKIHLHGNERMHQMFFFFF